MRHLSLSEAAEEVGASKTTIWLAIKSGEMSAAPTYDGDYDIDPAELFRVFRSKRHEQLPKGRGATDTAVEPVELALKLAVVDVEVRGLWALLEEMKASRNELRLERDRWRELAESSLTGEVVGASPSQARSQFAWPIAGPDRKTA